MRYLDLMAERPLVWSLFLLYMGATAALAWRGHKKTDDIRSFSIGRGDLSPVVVGFTLAASIASTATFVINPGFVYTHGVSALINMGVATGLGLFVGLGVMSFGFRRLGERSGAITLPQWIGRRYDSRGMALFFAATNLLSLCFVVLILGGVSIVMQQTLGLGNVESLVVITVFVFSYIFVGGTYAHAYTNTLQAGIMAVVTVVILASGLHLLGDGSFFGRVAAIDPNLVEPVNPASPLFGSAFSVYVCGFVIGFGCVCQPHIMTKALYVRDDRAVRRYLAVAIGITALFLGLLAVGLYARLDGLPPGTRQDAVMTAYVAQTFPAPVVALITVALMAAGMSTLDGILVALSSIAANDLFLPLTERNVLRGRSEHDRARIAHRASQVILVAMGVAAFLIALHPPKLLGIFGQVGVFGILAASVVPILFGIVVPEVSARWMFGAAITGLAVHFGLYAWGAWASSAGVQLTEVVAGWGPLRALFDESVAQLGLRNPGVCGTYGILASAAVAAPSAVRATVRKRRELAAATT